MKQRLAQKSFGQSSALVIMVVLVLNVLITGCTRVDAEQGVAQTVVPATATATNAATPTLSHLDASATKIAFDEAERGAVATLIARGTPFVSTPLPIATDEPIPTPALGIAGCGDADNEFNHVNCWKGLINGGYIFVNAGAPWKDQSQGTLRVITSTLDLQTYGHWQSYTTANRAGLIRVVEAVGERLTLRADDGTLFYFDVLTRQWVTLTPSPGPSPVPSLLPTP